MIKNIASVAVAVVGSGVLLTGCNFDQPSAGCIVQDAVTNWVVKYDLKEGQSIPAGCETKLALKGEALGVFKFTDPDKANSSVLTLRPQGLYSRASRDPGDPALQNAIGKLDDETDAQDFCGANEFNPATVNATSNATEGATSISYQFANIKVYSSPDAPGTQLTGDLTYTRDGCTAQFTARAMWPAKPCDPESEKQSEKCGEGSGINPDFAVTCDTSFKAAGGAGTCVPEKAIPSFKVDRN